MMLEKDNGQSRVKIINWREPTSMGARTERGRLDWNKRLAGKTGAEQWTPLKMEMVQTQSRYIPSKEKRTGQTNPELPG